MLSGPLLEDVLHVLEREGGRDADVHGGSPIGVVEVKKGGEGGEGESTLQSGCS